MPRSYLGSGVALEHPVDYGKMIDLHRAVNPTAMLGMVDGAKDLDKIVQFQHDLPGVQMIGRVWHPEEGGYAQKPTGLNDNRPMIATPDDVLQQQIDLGHDGRWLHVMNEPSMFLSTEKVQLTIDWLVKFIRLAAPENCACVLGNLADLHPAIINGMWDPITWPFLQELAKYPDLMRLGLHFYGPDRVTDVLTALNETCKYLRIMPSQVVGTEFGVDSTGQGDKANGYHTRGWIGEQFLRWEKSTIQGALKPFIQSGQLLGVLTFEWNALWGDFSIAKDKGYQDAYKDAASAGELDVEVITVNTKPKYVPGEIPESASGGFYYIIKYPKGSKVRNLRALPGADSADIGDVKEDALIKLFDLPLEKDSIQRKWQCCVLVDRTSGEILGKGWLWTDDVQLIPTTLETAVTPPVDTQPDPQPTEPAPDSPAEEQPAPPQETWPAPAPILRWKLTAEVAATGDQIQNIIKGAQTILEGLGYFGLANGATITIVPELISTEAINGQSA